MRTLTMQQLKLFIAYADIGMAVEQEKPMMLAQNLAIVRAANAKDKDALRAKLNEAETTIMRAGF